MKISPAKTAATPASRNSVVVVIVMSVLSGLGQYPERSAHRHLLRESDGVVCAGPRNRVDCSPRCCSHWSTLTQWAVSDSADSHRGIPSRLPDSSRMDGPGVRKLLRRAAFGAIERTYG